MTITDYFSYENKPAVLRQLEALREAWRAIPFLLSLIADGTFHERLGNGHLLLLLDEERLTGGEPTLAAFLTLCDCDEIDAPELFPWIGFVFTRAEYRGRRLAGALIESAVTLCRTEWPRSQFVYVSTDATGLYEKYGFAFYKQMRTVWGEDTRTYRRVTKRKELI